MIGVSLFVGDAESKVGIVWGSRASFPPHPHPPQEPIPPYSPITQVETKVLTFSELDAAAGLTRWRLADVRVNRTGGKGRGLNRKQRDAVYELPLATLRHVNLHIDF